MATIIRTGGGDADLSVVTAGAADVLAGKVIVGANGNALNGTISSKSAATITPGTTDQTIAAGQYLSGIQTILGDPNLTAPNVKKGVNMFGVVGTALVPDATTYETASFSTTKKDPVTRVFTFTKTPLFFIIYATTDWSQCWGAYDFVNGWSISAVNSGGNLFLNSWEWSAVNQAEKTISARAYGDYTTHFNRTENWTWHCLEA